jgi:acetyl-CoA synthetase
MDSTHNDFELVRKFSAHPDYASFFWKEIAREYLSVEPGREQIPMWNDEVFSSGHGTTKDKLQFMKDVKINACYYLVDRNIEMGLGNKPALYYVPRNWEKDGTKTIQYNELKEEVCIVSNVILRILEGSGGTGGETAPCVVIYLPDYPQLVYVILACFRLGYVPIVAYRAHDISMLNRIVEECKPKLAVTADIACNNAPGGENSMAVILIKTLKSSGKNNDCFVLLMDPGIRSDEMLLQQRGDYLLPRTELDDHFDHDRHFWYREISQSVPKDHQYDTFEANNPLFYACTSGSTGSPKIVEHRTLGYLLNVVVVFKFMHLFQVNGPPSTSIQQDVSFCLPTLAWLYGMHSLLLGPLLTGGATVLYEREVPESKMVENVRQLIEKMKVTHLFTVPRFLNSFVRHATSRRVQ